MDREQIEALLKHKYEDGEICTGLYDAGLQYVVMDVVGSQITFQWFSTMETLDDLVPA